MTPRHWFMLIGTLLVALLPGFFTLPPTDRDEARYSQASIQMMETGDYVDIRFQDQPRWVKPAGIYWMQVATATPFGGPDAPIWAFRLPSLLGVLAAAAMTAWLGARMGGAMTGIIAGLLLGLTLMAAVEARTAKTDAMLLAAGTAAQIALFRLIVPAGPVRPRFWGWPALFWAATGAALMIKGPIVSLVTLFTLLTFALWTKDGWRVVPKLRPLPGLALAVAIAAPWLVAINVQTDGGFFMESVGHALLGKVAESDDSHAGPPGYHTLLLALTFWPGTALLGLAGVAAWQNRDDRAHQFLISWFVPTLLLFELIATKLPHYIFPAFPALALLAALGARDGVAYAAGRAGRILHSAALILALLATGVIASLPVIIAKMVGTDILLGFTGLALVFAVIVAGGLVAMRRGDMGGRALPAVILGAIGLYGTVFGGVLPRLDPLWPSAQVAKIVNSLEGCPTRRAITAGYREPSTVFHLGTETLLANTGEQAAAALVAAPECSLAIIDITEQVGFFTALADSDLAVEKVGTVTGLNMAKGDQLLLEIYISADSALAQR
ncbi:hypothetical protein PB2503_04662 [Parvularcula bermudensis HTCC2503]|uniref:ArnT-like N-terminal domain-containing protein n=2 Tax=Parvularcula TaxID=208215 RepID=E0TF89_PARBH|nr:hypothetical protein PB2503_04662 [Parvularcula bermudensis HTCC2503]